MDSVISALTNSTTGLTSATFYGEIAHLVPFIVLMVPISLGLYFLFVRAIIWIYKDIIELLVIDLEDMQSVDRGQV